MLRIYLLHIVPSGSGSEKCYPNRPGFHVMLDNGEEGFIDIPSSGRPTLNMVAGGIGDIVSFE